MINLREYFIQLWSFITFSVREKFEETQRFKIVCEDGCEIDDDGLFSLGNVPLTLHYVKEGEEFEACSQSGIDAYFLLSFILKNR